MKTTYYSVQTANTTYHLRHIEQGMNYVPSFGHPRNVIDAFGGRIGFFTLDSTERPRVGFPMTGHDATGRIRTSPVRSVRRISFREFAARA